MAERYTCLLEVQVSARTWEFESPWGHTYKNIDMKVLKVKSKATKEKERPAHVMPVHDSVIAPRTIMTYQHYDVKNITGLEASYSYISEGRCTIKCFRDDKNNEYSATEVQEIVYRYMKDNGIIPQDSKPCGGMRPEHYYSNPDENGYSSSRYSFEFYISIR